MGRPQGWKEPRVRTLTTMRPRLDLIQREKDQGAACHGKGWARQGAGVLSHCHSLNRGPRLLLGSIAASGVIGTRLGRAEPQMPVAQRREKKTLWPRPARGP